MKTTKRFMTVLLALCMLFSMVMPALSVSAATVASGTCGKNVTWKLDDKGTLTISGSGEMYNYDKTTMPWYDYRDKIKSVVISNGVTRIGDYAFRDCNSLTSVTVPKSINQIGSYAFWICNSLSSVYITDIAAWCKIDFEMWSSNPLYYSNKIYLNGKLVTELVIPSGVTAIGNYAFEYGDCLTKVTIPVGVKTIGNNAFANCKSLNSVIIPNSVTNIGEYAFSNCESLTGVTVPNSVTNIGEYAFANCKSLTGLTIPNSVTGIGNSAFEGCSSIASMTIPNSVTAVGNDVFAFCSSLTSVTIGKGVSTIAYGVFYKCSSLKSIIFQGNAPKFVNESFNGVKATAYYPSGNKTWTSSVRKNYGGDITWKAYSTAAPVPADPYKIANVVSGVHVYWKAVDGITKYGLYRSETGKNGTYKWIANPTAAHFTDTNVQSGKTYYYKVTSLNTYTNTHSAMSGALGIVFVSTPDITSRVNSASGIKLGWNKISGATGYAIYRKSYSGNDAWVRVATISGNSTFTWTDTAVKNNNGTIYKYTIRALAGSDLKTLSGCRNAGRTMVRLTSRTLNSATKASSTSIKCTWTTTSQATGYEVRFMVGNSVYKTYTISNYNTGTKTFTGLKAGQTYKIQVRAYKNVSGVGSFYSAWSTAKNVKL